MNCPVCQYPNAAGATHCGMCYEVFNRSAAQTYLHAVQKERRQTEGVPEEPIVADQAGEKWRTKPEASRPKSIGRPLEKLRRSFIKRNLSINPF